jgi:hypothetical protein
LAAAALCLAGCGKQERSEAVQLGKTLTAKRVNFSSANATEKDFIASARAWCDGITTNGAGRGAELDQNAAVATGLAKYAVTISEQLSAVRQAMDGDTLQAEYPRHVRNQLTTQLTERQRRLQDMRALLEAAAPQFLEYKNNRSYTGDTYPEGLVRLQALLRAYQAPEDAVGGAINDLKTKYSLRDDELSSGGMAPAATPAGGA